MNPRDALINIVSGFICRNIFASQNCLFSSRPSMCIEITSLSKSNCSIGTDVQPCVSWIVTTSLNNTRNPIDFAIFPSLLPILPKPMMPSVVSVNSLVVNDASRRASHLSWESGPVTFCRLRKPESIVVKTNPTTDSLFASGVCTTVMPRSLHA